MKIRHGFVSNSSTTSFTCEICGRTEVFHDSGSHRDYGFIVCTNEHFLCDEELLEGWKELEEPNEEEYPTIVEYEKAYEEYQKNMSYCAEVSSQYCPICQFEEFSLREIKLYLQKKNPTPDEEILQDIKKFNKRRKKVYLHEEIQYILNLRKQTIVELQQEIKDIYKEYNKFREFIYGETEQ